MALVEVTIPDAVRGNPNKKIPVRFDSEDCVVVACSVNYDPFLDEEVRIPRRVEVLEYDIWQLYPSVSWLDGMTDEDQLQTMVLVKKTGENKLTIMGSPNGVPDGRLMIAAQEAGVHTETIDG